MMRSAIPICMLLVLSVPPLFGQTAGRGWDPTGLQLTRAELETLLDQFESTAASSAYSGVMRARARDEAALIRVRLEEGDLRVGDQITLDVESHPALSAAYTVVAGRRIILPDIGEIPLEGVLRSELQDYMTSHLSRYLVAPVVRARSLIRVEVLGTVGSPGFYMIPSDMLLSEALMQAGGPGGNAALDRIEIRRGREVLWQGQRLRDAMIEGRTLDQLSVRAGDGILVPRNRDSLSTLTRGLGVVTGIASLYFLFTRTGVF